jgi:hypothetical protein
MTATDLLIIVGLALLFGWPVALGVLVCAILFVALFGK